MHCWGKPPPHHGFHLPVVATVSPDGRPEARAVVLRGAGRDGRWLQFHTDARSPKLAALSRHPNVALLFYDPAEQTQLRIDATTTLHRADAVADAAWEQTGPFSRRCYLQSVAPGGPLAGPGSALPPSLATRAPEPEESERGRTNFVVVRCRILTIDWFYLCSSGHRRARFAWDAAGALAAEWIAP